MQKQGAFLIQKGDAMAIIEENRKKRIAQLKACAEGIINNAEDIIGNADNPVDWKIIIDIQCNEFPTVKVERHFVPQELIDELK